MVAALALTSGAFSLARHKGASSSSNKALQREVFMSFQYGVGANERTSFGEFESK